MDTKEILTTIRSRSGKDALAYIEALTLSEPENIDLTYLKASLAADAGAYEEAKSAFFSVLDKKPDSELVRLQLALVHFSLGEFRQLQYLLAAYLVWQTQDSCIANISHSLLNIVKGDFSLACKYLEQAKLSPQPDQDLLSDTIGKLSIYYEKIKEEDESTDSDLNEPGKNRIERIMLNNLYNKKY